MGDKNRGETEIKRVIFGCMNKEWGLGIKCSGHQPFIHFFFNLNFNYILYSPKKSSTINIYLCTYVYSANTIIAQLT